MKTTVYETTDSYAFNKRIAPNISSLQENCEVLFYFSSITGNLFAAIQVYSMKNNKEIDCLINCYLQDTK